MIYIDNIVKEMANCSQQVQILENNIPLNNDPCKRNLMQMELDQAEMYRYSLNRLMSSFNKNLKAVS